MVASPPASGQTCALAQFEALEPRRLCTALAAPVEAPPRVREVYFDSSSWSGAFRQYLEDTARGSAEFGFRATELTIMPWTNIDRVTVEFPSGVTVDLADLSLRGVNVRNYAFTSLDFHSDTFRSIATWNLSRPLGPDRLLLELNGDPPDGIHGGGQYLDGNFDGVPGDDYRMEPNVLPGSTGRRPYVDPADLRGIRLLYGRTTSDRVFPPSIYSPYSDLNGDGRINVIDAAEARRCIGTYLPFSSPTLTSETAAPLRTRPTTRSLFSTEPILA